MQQQTLIGDVLSVLDKSLVRFSSTLTSGAAAYRADNDAISVYLYRDEWQDMKGQTYRTDGLAYTQVTLPNDMVPNQSGVLQIKVK